MKGIEMPDIKQPDPVAASWRLPWIMQPVSSQECRRCGCSDILGGPRQQIRHDAQPSPTAAHDDTKTVIIVKDRSEITKADKRPKTSTRSPVCRHRRKCFHATEH